MERSPVLPHPANTPGDLVNTPTAWCHLMGTGIAENY